MDNKISEEKIVYFRKKIISWGKENYADFPWRKTENRWHALVAEIMLQRTVAEQVVPSYKSFVSKYLTPEDYLADNNTHVFQNLGLHWREKQLRNLGEILSRKDIPKGRKELMELPGIGEYIASAFRSLHLDIRDVIIDSNIVRIYGRFFGFKTDGETRRKKWFKELAERMTPEEDFRAFNYGLIDFTRLICKPIPLCKKCIINKKCIYTIKLSIKAK